MSDTVSNHSVYMITDPEQIEQAKALMIDIFGERDYFEKLFACNTDKRIFAMSDNGNICACAVLYTYERIGYVYSMCVSHSHRGRGFFKSLCKYIIRFGRFGYDRIFLVPADAGLFASYKKLGFDTVLSSKLYDIHDCDCEPTLISDDFYTAYSQSVDFVIDREVLELHFMFSSDRPAKVFKNGKFIGYGAVSSDHKLISVYPLNSDIYIQYTKKENIALSIDYTERLEKFTDGVYID